MKVEVDKTGGTDYVEMSNQQLWSVPYALYSGYSSSSGYADSSAYADIAGNGLTGVTDNGDGTLTFTYYDGSTYTTSVLSGLGSVGPQGPAGADGQDGLSAYEIWLSQGNTGTEVDFLNGLTGASGNDGLDGTDGLSAYEIWLAQGNTGTEADFLTGITGPQGFAGINGIDGTDGQDGQSAYEIWLSLGNMGTEQDFLNSLEGPQGPAGTNGIDGADGLSAYEVWLSQVNTGTEQDFLNGIIGPQGPTGTNGVDGATGPAGSDGNGIASTTGNGDGTITFTYDDGTTSIVNIEDADSDSTNELQDWSTLPGIPLELTDGDDVDDADNDPANELQVLSLSNDTLYLSQSNLVFLGNIQSSLNIDYDSLANTIVSDTAFNLNEYGCNLSLGDTYQGGVIFYIDPSGCHGLICSPTDFGSFEDWNYPLLNDVPCNAYGSSLFDGKYNTEKIQFTHGDNSVSAAGICSNLTLNGYDDWYLPSVYELKLLLYNLGPCSTLDLGNISSTFVETGDYWSSTEVAASWAFYVNSSFCSGNPSSPLGYDIGLKQSHGGYVRPIRQF